MKGREVRPIETFAAANTVNDHGEEREVELVKCRLVVNSNPKPGREREYNSWYSEQHLPDVLKAPGMKSAERMVVVEDSGYRIDLKHRYLTIYDVETDDPAGLKQLLQDRADQGLSPWSPDIAMDYQVALYRVIAEVGA